MTFVFKICVLHTMRDAFDYFAGDIEPQIGARVLVPFRRKTRVGIVIAKVKIEPLPTTKTILTVVDDTPLLTGEVLMLCQWISRYYQSPLSEVIPLALPKKYREGSVFQWPVSQDYRLLIPVEMAHLLLPKNAHRQHQLLDFFAKHPDPIPKHQLLQEGFLSASLAPLLNKGILECQSQRVRPMSTHLLPEQPLALNAEQALAVGQINQDLQSYRCFLLQGVTGSGKTEVYLQVIARVLALGRQVLVLVPEIGLTPQLLARFRVRFREPMAVIHSELNDTERQMAWMWAKEEEVKLVIGTRSAIFTPMPALGLIVIDEEHDASLKQLDGVRYSARDTALMRAHLRHIPIILGSATPSLESLHNCSLNKYTKLCLNQKALDSVPLLYEIQDVRNVTLQDGLSSATVARIRAHLQQKNQVLIFINRRGFSPVLLCHQCGWMADCIACDAHLTLHRLKGRLVCHHCGLNQRIPTVCHACKSRELHPLGAGTQRVHEYLTREFPTTTLVRIDRDEVQKKNALDACLAQINDGTVQLIVGTQMLAKGHHFPRLTLVVVLDTDNGFFNHDFRALERLGQLLVQVAGRAGRAEYPGQVLIQTHVPHHPLLNLLIQEGYDVFAQALLEKRREADMPPFHFLSVIRAEARHLPKVLEFLHAAKLKLSREHLNILGPAPAPLARKASHHRMQLLVKSASRQTLKLALTELCEWLTMNPLCSGIRWNVDVDPMDLS
ncbi:MAG: primosomal protein N' [Legionellales bacterium]|nr:primosomal protein N' [Legionellales bacterium]